MTSESRRSYEFDRFRLDADERVLLRDGAPVALGPKVIDTLIALVENAGHIVEKGELISRVWPDSFVEDGSLTKNISILRRVLEDGAGNQFIENVPRRGYRFNAVVTPSNDLDGETVIARRATLKIVSEGDDADSIAEVITASSLTRRKEGFKSGVQTLAVLPFRSLGAGETDLYLGLGLADALITRLSNAREMIVRPTSAVVSYLGNAGQDAIQAGRELRVDLVLDGSIRRSDDRIRISVQLVSVESEAALWADRFDAQFTGVFEVEDLISEQVVRALTLRLTGDERKLLTKHHTQDPEAYKAYLKGRYFWNARTSGWLQKATGHFRQAISIDPEYALAHAGLADCYNALGFWTYLPPGNSFPLARTAAIRALELDETLAEAHAALAWELLHYDWDFAGAEREFKRAIELNPGYGSAHLWYAMFLALVGRFDEAFVEITLAEQIDPMSLILNTDIGILFLLMRRYDEAIEQFHRTLDLGPGYPLALEFLAYTYGLKGMFELCRAGYQKVADMCADSADSRIKLSLANAIVGCKAEAQELADDVKQLSKNRYFSPHHFAQVYSFLGDSDETFFWLERSYEERSPWIAWLGVNPTYDWLRTDPRYEGLLQRAGLAEVGSRI
jgi:DNA-binding winged helix-turn-helix (wHTH) protein/tetratricopeptide (TPR) repeat protein